MKHLRLYFPYLFIFVICSFFFYKLFLGQIPFPGDLLVGNYAPYNTLSYGNFLPGTVPHKAQGPDVIKELFPWKHFVIEEFKKFHIPFWDPYNFSGNPMMANFQSGTFYVGNILFFFFPFTLSWSIFIFLIPLLAALFTYLFLRELALSKIASIFGGIVFAFSSYMVVWMEYGNIGHTMLYLPLSLYALEKLVKKIEKKYLVLFILSNWLAFSAGYIQGYFYSTSVLFFYFFMKEYPFKKLSLRRLIFFVLVLILPVFLSLYQLLPTLQLFQFSSRGAYSLAQITHLLNPWWYSVTTVVPDFFGNPASRNNWVDRTYIESVSYFGVIPLFLALGALFYYKKRKEILIFGIIFILSYLLSIDIGITRYFYLLPIPVLTTTVPTRILSLFVFSGSVLAAYGLHMLIREKIVTIWFAVISFLGIILVFSWIIVFVAPQLLHGINAIDAVSVVKRNLMIPTCLYLFMTFYIVIRYGAKSNTVAVRYFSRFNRFYDLKISSIYLIFLLTFFELAYFFFKITPFSPTTYVYPQTPLLAYIQKHAGINRFWGYGSGYIESNFQTYDRTYSPEGNDPLHILSYTKLVSSTGNGTVPSILPRPDARIAPGFAKDELQKNQYRKKILDLLGIKFIVYKNEAISDNTTPQADYQVFSKKDYTIVWQDTPWQIYENISVAPRAFITSDYQVLADNDTLLKKIYTPSFDPRKTVLLTKNPGISKGNTSGSVHVVAYTPDRITLKAETTEDALLFLSDTYYPAWHVTVDGKESTIFQADYAFRANVVPKGLHEIVYYYNDKTFYIGLLISSICIVGFILWLLRVNTSMYE